MPSPRPTSSTASVKVSVNVANVNVRGNANMRITRSRRGHVAENTLNNESVLILDEESPVENSDVSINIRNEVNSINNDFQIVEDHPSRGNNTVNLDDAMINVTGNDIRNDDNSNVEIIENEEDLNPDNNTINLEDSTAIRNSNTTNVMEIVEDNQSADNNTINLELEDSIAIELEVEIQDDEGGNVGGGDSDVVDLTDRQDSQTPVSSSMNSRTPRRQLPQLDDSNVIDLTNSPTPSSTSLPALLPLTAFSSKASSSQLAGCSICLDTYVEIKDVGKTLMSTTCGHVFCSTCLESSLKNNGKTCPVCRKRLKNGDYHPLYL